MVWGMFRFLVVLFISTLLINPVYSEDYSNYSGNTIIQNDFSEYMKGVQSKIQRNWNPPDFGEDGQAVILFKISRRGDLVNTEVVQSSNNEVFDESALEALKKASPFGKFPANTARDSLTIKYTFNTSVVKTDSMREYVQNADRYYNVNNRVALDYINRAIDEVEGDISSYFLYGKRSKIKMALGDTEGAEKDLNECKRLKAKYDQKRIMSGKLLVETEQTPFSYFYLAHSYEIAGDYEHALEAIDKAIELTELNNQYKRYKNELRQKSGL